MSAYTIKGETLNYEMVAMGRRHSDAKSVAWTYENSSH